MEETVGTITPVPVGERALQHQLFVDIAQQFLKIISGQSMQDGISEIVDDVGQYSPWMMMEEIEPEIPKK